VSPDRLSKPRSAKNLIRAIGTQLNDRNGIMLLELNFMNQQD